MGLKMSTQQTQVDESSASKLDICPECGRSYPHASYLDHLFQNKDCMRRYWQDEEKTHIFRLRRGHGTKNIPK